MLKRWRYDEQGATAIEYALIASLISIAIVGGLSLMTSGTDSLYGRVKTAFETYMGG